MGVARSGEELRNCVILRHVSLGVDTLGIHGLRLRYNQSQGRKDMCVFEGCINSGPYSGLCKGHHRQKLAGIELKALRPYKSRSMPREKKNCAYDGCTKDKYPGNIIYCRRHQEIFLSDKKMRPLRKYTSKAA